MSGKIFLDFLGLKDQDNGNRQSFQIADFKVDFSRDIIELPSTLDQIRARVKSEKRVTSKDYTSENNNSTQEEWNADCIFASDNHMKYGYGLLITTNNTFMETVSYNNNQSNLQHPEQHLANRVTSYWAASKRRVKAELRTEAITEPQPSRKVTLDGTTFNAIAISHEWRDDVTTLTLLEM